MIVAFGQIPAGCTAYKHLGGWVERLQGEAFSGNEVLMWECGHCIKGDRKIPIFFFSNEDL